MTEFSKLIGRADREKEKGHFEGTLESEEQSLESSSKPTLEDDKENDYSEKMGGEDIMEIIDLMAS